MKKINRRDFLKVLGAAGMTASLAACGSGSSGSTASGSGAASGGGADDGKITISYWTTDRHDQAYLTPLIEQYNETNSDNLY